MNPYIKTKLRHMFPGEALVSSLFCVMFLKYKKCLFIFVTVAIMLMIDTLILMKSHGVEYVS